jgi:hypothetical protein
MSFPISNVCFFTLYGFLYNSYCASLKSCDRKSKDIFNSRQISYSSDYLGSVYLIGHIFCERALARTHTHTHAHNLYLTKLTINEDIHAPGGNRICNPSKRATANPHLKLHSQWDLTVIVILIHIFTVHHCHFHSLIPTGALRSL